MLVREQINDQLNHSNTVSAARGDSTQERSRLEVLFTPRIADALHGSFEPLAAKQGYRGKRSGRSEGFRY